MTKDEILNLQIDYKTNIRGYLENLLLHLWSKQESFSGEKPFGNSGWEYSLYIPLLRAGIIEGKIDEYGDVEEIDTKAGWKVIYDLIVYIFEEKEDV